MSKTVDQLIKKFKVDIAYNQYAFDNKKRERDSFIKYEEDKQKEFTEAINQLIIEAKIEALDTVRMYLNEEIERFEPSTDFDSIALAEKIDNYAQSLKEIK